jgi:eukaryotic-like serine/threonine-protein kinase
VVSILTWRRNWPTICDTLPDTVPLTVGTRLGPYEITGPLGAGGMGEVYRARDTRLERDVALKILPEELAKDASRRQRFELEARAVAALNHPNIVAIYDVGDGYIVSELVDGEPLRGAKPGLRRTVEIAVQVAAGLAAAHDAGIVHRDLKPDNILLTRGGRPKILDFGLAKVLAARAAVADTTVTVRTEAGVVMGTPGYMSPEQVRGLAVDHRSDIFSFGVILHELLAGKRAFQGETSVDTMQAILRQEAPELPAATPQPLRQIVAHCLEKEAGKRFQSAHDLEFALASMSQTGGQPALAPARISRRPTFLAGLAALALLSGGLAAGKFLLTTPSSPNWSGVLLGGPEMALNPRLSPDSHWLAFQAFDQALTQVAVMKPESGNWSILTHRRDCGQVTNVSWSADGSLIYYDRDADVPLGIYSVPVLGGEEHLVLEHALAPEVLADGSLVIQRVNAHGQMQLYRFWPETGRLQEFALEAPATGSSAIGSRMASGGREVITFASPIGRGRQGLGFYAIDLASNAIRRLAVKEQDAALVQSWTVSHDGKTVLAALPAGSIMHLVSIPTRGDSTARTLFTATSLVWGIDAGMDGSLFLNLVDRPQELVRLAADGGEPPARLAVFPLGASPDQVLLLPDGRIVTAAMVSGRIRLMAAAAGKEPLPLLNTSEEASSPMALAGPREIAFAIGPAPHVTMALAETASGRISRRFAPGKGVITGITASPDGSTLYFCATDSIWSVAATGGDARAVTKGNGVLMEPSGRSLMVTRGESSQIRLFHVPLDGGAESEIPSDRSMLLYHDHGGYFTSGSVDAKGRALFSVSPLDSWFNPLAILDTATGHITRVPGDNLSDHHAALWTPDGHIISTQIGLRATIWKFQPEGQ